MRTHPLPLTFAAGAFCLATACDLDFIPADARGGPLDVIVSVEGVHADFLEMDLEVELLGGSFAPWMWLVDGPSLTVRGRPDGLWRGTVVAALDPSNPTAELRVDPGDREPLAVPLSVPVRGGPATWTSQGHLRLPVDRGAFVTGGQPEGWGISFLDGTGQVVGTFEHGGGPLPDPVEVEGPLVPQEATRAMVRTRVTREEATPEFHVLASLTARIEFPIPR